MNDLGDLRRGWMTHRWRIRIATAICLTLLLAAGESTHAGDMAVVPLLDGERADSLNLWGGPLGSGNVNSFSKQSAVVRTGTAAYRADLGSTPGGGFRFFQMFSSQVSGTPGYRQDRDLSPYEWLEGYIRNDAGAPLTFSIELKDYRDSTDHVARRSYVAPTGGWTRIVAPLSLDAGWNVTGNPALERTFAISFIVGADYGAINGSLYLDDFRLRERGPSIDVAQASLETIVERLARRQFWGLWAARNKMSGLIPNTSDNVTLGALNTTTGVVWTLPAAIRRGWVSQEDADAYLTQLVGSLNSNRDQTTYLPTRFLDLATAAPVTDREESTIDAAFIALALHNYKTQPATPAGLRAAIDALQERFNFAAFAGSEAYNLGYVPSRGMSQYAYNGYTHENKVISLAGELSRSHHVPLESMWNKDTGRTLAFLVDPSDQFLTYSFGTEHRAPFLQALLNLFVDTSERGADNYPVRTMARNPWINFVRHQDEVADKLAQLGRSDFLQPDAGRGAAGYQPYNLFNNFGEPELFMPWSVAFALMAGAEGSEEALRFLLDNGLGSGLDGPLGLADSAQWAAGSQDPTDVPSSADNWNVALSTMALLVFLDGSERASRQFARLPEVSSALDRVFLDGDLDANGVTDAADLLIWKSGFGTSASATPADGDANADGDVDGADFLRWQRGFGIQPGTATTPDAIPEPAGMSLAAVAAAVALGRPLRRQGPRNPLKALATPVSAPTITE